MRGTSGPEFEAAIEEYRPALLAWAVHKVGMDDAEDLVQDALLRAVAVSPRPRSSWRTWLFAIASYVYHERSATHPPLELVEGLGATDLVGRAIASTY